MEVMTAMLEPTAHTDCQPIHQARIEDLDMGLVQRHISRAQERGRLTGPAEPLPYLQRHHGVIAIDGMLVPTLAGVLTFALEPEQWITTAGIDLAQFKGTSPRSTHLRFLEQVRGPLFAVIDRAAQILWDRSEHGYHLEGNQRVEDHTYPQIVLRELTTNALCHRDWSQSGSRVRIQMFDQMVEWISPGGLPAGITIENLLEAQYSRNPAIVTFLFHAGYIEGLGLGMDTVFSALREAGSPPPQMRNVPHAFTICVDAKPLATDTATPTLHGTSRKETILLLLDHHGSLSIKELEQLLGVHRRTLQRDLRDLIASQQIATTGATNQRRYHLVPPDNL